MEREIKFRAFIDGEMVNSDALAFEEYAPIADLLSKCQNLMQFTGFKDKSGVEIYEGDIMQKWDSVFRVEVNNDFSYRLTDVKSGERFPLSDNHVILSVVGNIHQNPELLP